MLIGRRHELEELELLLGHAAAGRGGLRALVGEPGIGKTRLADEVGELARERGFRVAWGRASETGGAPAYDPWIQLLRILVGGSGDPPAAVRTLIDGAAGYAASPAGRDPLRERLERVEAVAGFLRQRAAEAPLLIVLDDLHVADPPSLELLAHVARGSRGARLALVATWRAPEARAPAIADLIARITREGERIALGPLSRAEVEVAARRALERVDADLAEQLFELTEGNPLFLGEALHAIAGAPPGGSGAFLRQVAASGGVLAVARGRLAGSEPELRALLEAAAALGRESRTPVLAEVAGRDAAATERLLREAAARGLMVQLGDDRWTFGHVLLREAFYRDLSDGRRCALHAAAAAALAGRAARGRTEELAALAHHAIAALPLGDVATASRHVRRAADHARAQLAWDEASAILERALASFERLEVPPAERAEIELALGWSATDAGQLDRARRIFRAVADQARRLGDARLLARAAIGQGGHYVLGENRGDLIASLEEALGALGDPDEIDGRRLQARLLARLAAARTPSPTSADEPLALARRALAMIEADDDPRTRIDVDLAAGSALCAFGTPAERVPINERLLRGARDLGDRVLELRALVRLACDHLERGDLAASDEIIARADSLGDDLGHPRYRWRTPLLRSMRWTPAGRFGLCEEEIERARAIAREDEDEREVAARCIDMHHYFVALLGGRSAALAEREAGALAAVSVLPDGPSRRDLLTGLTAARLGDHGRARARLSAMPASLSWSPMWRSYAAQAAVLCGARGVYERLDPTLEPDDRPVVCSGPYAFACSPPVAWARALTAFALGRREEAAAACDRALALAERAGARALAAWIQLAWGEGLGPEHGGDHLDRALALAEELGMSDVATRAASAAAGDSPGSETAPAAPRSPAGHASHSPVLCASPDGREWSISHGGRVHRVKAVRGLAMLKRLLDSPHREIHALELCAEPPGGAGVDLGDAGPVLDPAARRAYAARLADLQAELEQAERFQDAGRAARLRGELDGLRHHLAGALGLGRRARRSSSPAERARIAVQKRVREAIRRIGDHDPELGRHLDWTVRTGTYCAYEPDGRRAR